MKTNAEITAELNQVQQRQSNLTNEKVRIASEIQKHEKAIREGDVSHVAEYAGLKAALDLVDTSITDTDKALQAKIAERAQVEVLEGKREAWANMAALAKRYEVECQKLDKALEIAVAEFTATLDRLKPEVRAVESTLSQFRGAAVSVEKNAFHWGSRGTAGGAIIGHDEFARELQALLGAADAQKMMQDAMYPSDGIKRAKRNPDRRTQAIYAAIEAAARGEN